MLGHQLPALPPVESFWGALPEFFAWLETGMAPARPAAYRMAAGETVLRERTFRLPVSEPAQSHLEIIRFAATNRLCVDLDYQASTRRIEPYSLRRTRDGNIVLHAFNTDKAAHCSYRVDRIAGARITSQTFVPRYAVELSPQGPVSVPPTARQSGSSGAVRAPRRRATRSRTGPRHVYECSYCGKRFYRKTRTSRLNQHKGRSGYRCPGRTAIYLGTRY